MIDNNPLLYTFSTCLMQCKDFRVVRGLETKVCFVDFLEIIVPSKVQKRYYIYELVLWGSNKYLIIA